MTTLSPETTGAIRAGPRTSCRPWAVTGAGRQVALAGTVGLVALLAIGLRCWNPGATFESSDQVAMAHFVRHSFGIKWLFAHAYGPVPAVVQRTFAEILSRLGVAMGEASCRLPVMAISLAQVVLTFPLLLRLRCSRAEAVLGMLCCAVLPTLVTDGHYSWTYFSAWLFAGTLSLWATLAYFDGGRIWQLAVAALSLLAHCLSNCFAFALPLTLIVAWTVAMRRQPPAEREHGSGASLRSAAIGLALPCIAALVVIFMSWLWTGEGQLCRLLVKHRHGTTGLHLDQLARLPAMWGAQFGYLFGMIAGVAVVLGPVAVADRRKLLAVWAWAAALPVILLADWDRIGYPGAYLIEAVYASGLLGIMLISRAYRKLATRPRTRAVLATAVVLALGHMAVGAADDSLAGGRLARYTGINTGWGNVKPDTGIKAAGWYVRQHVPMNAVVLALHTNKGMEVPVAEYYTGRRVLAGYDLKPEVLEPLVQHTHGAADVIIVRAQHRPLVDVLDDFECVCTLRNNGEPVRFIYARPELSLPELDEEVAVINPRYDKAFRPRDIPIPLPAPVGFTDALTRYQQIVRQLNELMNQISKRSCYRFSRSAAWQPEVNIYEGDADFYVCVELAGLAKDQINMEARLTDGFLWITIGKRAA